MVLISQVFAKRYFQNQNPICLGFHVLLVDNALGFVFVQELSYRRVPVSFSRASSMHFVDTHLKSSGLPG